MQTLPFFSISPEQEGGSKEQGMCSHYVTERPQTFGVGTHVAESPGPPQPPAWSWERILCCGNVILLSPSLALWCMLMSRQLSGLDLPGDSAWRQQILMEAAGESANYFFVLRKEKAGVQISSFTEVPTPWAPAKFPTEQRGTHKISVPPGGKTRLYFTQFGTHRPVVAP